MANKAKPNRKRRIQPWHHPLTTRINDGLDRMRTALQAVEAQMPLIWLRLEPRLRWLRGRAWQLACLLLNRSKVAIRWAIPRLNAQFRRLTPILAGALQRTARRIFLLMDPAVVRVDTPPRHRMHTLLLTLTFAAILIAAGTMMACTA